MSIHLHRKALHAAVAMALGASVLSVDARVTRIVVDSTTPVAGGPFGTVGAYELVRGSAFGELDPNDRRNAVITDITLAPKNANGKVEYRSQFTIY